MPSTVPQILLSLYSSASQIQKHPPGSSKAPPRRKQKHNMEDPGSLSHHLDKSFPREPSTVPFFHWRIMALQHCVGCCHTPTRISHSIHTSPPSHWPPPPPPICQRALDWVPCVTQKLPSGYLVYIREPSTLDDRVSKDISTISSHWAFRAYLLQQLALLIMTDTPFQ